MRIRYTLVLALVMLLALATAAAATTGFFASLTGAQEVPANASPATGTGVFVVDNTGTSMTYAVTFSGLIGGITASHIHQAAPGVNGPIIIPFSITSVSGLHAGTFSGVAGVTAANVAAMLAGNTYANIHSTIFTGGEIRGQVAADPTPSLHTSWGRIKSLYR